MTKKKLPVIGKSLMPEVLPDPLRAKEGDGASARARVRSRLEQIKTNAAAFAAASAIASCSDTGGSKYGVVDPLPPPAGSGASGTGPKWPAAGYGVVDPLPPPAGRGGVGGPPPPAAGTGQPPVVVQCTSATPETLDAKSAKAIWLSKSAMLFTISPAPGVPPTAVQLTQIISNASNATDLSAGQVPFSIRLDSNPWPARTYLKLSATCGSALVQNSTLTFDIDTSAPRDSGDAPVTLRVPGDDDAGVP